jgi:hypothetical protein
MTIGLDVLMVLFIVGWLVACWGPPSNPDDKRGRWG